MLLKPARFVTPLRCKELIPDEQGQFHRCSAPLKLLPAELPVVTDEGALQGSKIVYVCASCKSIICS